MKLESYAGRFKELSELFAQHRCAELSKLFDDAADAAVRNDAAAGEMCLTRGLELIDELQGKYATMLRRLGHNLEAFRKDVAESAADKPTSRQSERRSV